ncbi:MAG: SH3 domain-containing protein [Anaerolineae bacterium]|nr:SH3 domain-containing protein [Anaerolineae bacterium]
MPYAKRVFLLLIWLVPLLLPGPVYSQSPESSCPQIVQIALSMADMLCQAMGTNRACYGHMLVDATPRPDVTALDFNQEGDIADVHALQAIRLSPMDLEIGTWGVALLNLQAYLQYTAPQEVTYVLFGDVEVTNAVEAVPTLLATVTTRQYVNVRLGPTTNAGVIATLAPGAVIEAKGRLADNSWLRVLIPDTGRVGWVYAPVLSLDGDIETLQVMEAWSPYYGPMQAFYFRSGVDDSVCQESPQSGLLIQTPEGVAEVTLLVNEVSIQMNATAYFQAQPGGQMTVGVLDGWAVVEANGGRQPVFAGTQVRIPMASNLAASSTPTEPEPYVQENLMALPISLLRHEVEISPALTAGEITALLARWRSLVRNGQTVTFASLYTEQGVEELTTVGDASGDAPEAPPGLEGVLPPGWGSTPPGQGGVPPGQGKKN